MPNVHGFDELPNRGNIELHCIWCDWRPGRISEARQAQHSRKHARDRAEAVEASKREVTTAQDAIAV